MFGSAYVVDVISDGEQLFDSGIIPTREIADKAFDLITADDMPDLDFVRTVEHTVRLIRDGEVLREATIKDGQVLAELNT